MFTPNYDALHVKMNIVKMVATILNLKVKWF